MFLNSVKLLLNLLAPRECAGCKKDKEILCSSCITSSFRFGGWCVFCNQRNVSGKICVNCRPVFAKSYGWQEYRYIDKILWVGEYNGALKRAIWELKYKKRKELAEPMAKLLYKKFLEFYPNYKKESFLIIPIPMHPQKKRERKFNQAEFLAKEFGKISGIEVSSDLLLKTRNTSAQVETKTKEERIKNLSGAFSVEDPNRVWINTNSIWAKIIILIDDVTTTGATFLHASHTIQKDGFEKIICLAVAHGYG